MIVYLAGEREINPNPELNAWRLARRRLFSYFYHGFKDGNVPTHEMHAASTTMENLFLDSGAFTAFTKKETIPPELYAEFVQSSRSMWTVCSSLDVIGSGEEAAQASYDMFHHLRKLGADVIPVFHVREPDHWLERYLAEGHEYLAIGGMVPETSGWLRERLDGLWGTVLTNDDGTARAKVHGFGLTTLSLMFRYPWHSVDSTSWLMTGVYGACVIPTTDRPSGIRRVFFSADSPQARKVDGWHYHSLTLVPDDPRRLAVDAVLARFGVTAEQCAESYIYRDLVNAAVFQEFEQFGRTTFRLQQATLFG